MTGKPSRPATVWIAVLINCVVGLAVLAFNGLGIYILATAKPSGPSVKDVGITIGFFVIFIVCFAGATLALLRFRISRLLPIVSVVILVLFTIDMFLGIKSFEFDERGLVTIVLAVSMLAILFFVALPGILLSFGNSVNAYFGVSSEDEDQQLLEPPPPPSSFS